jgi:pimeloyl-ACP methyl ester carboxylesterase
MRIAVRLFMLLTLLVAALAFAPASPARADAYPPCAPGSLPQLTGEPAGGAQWFICVPANWNGIVVVYGHGYESPVDPTNLKIQTPPTFANLTNPVDGAYLPALIESQGAAFGATTYRRTGLVVADGVEDMAAVAVAAKAFYASLPQPLPPLRIYATGVSEGGLVTALALERHPELFDGGLATCGPIGDFRKQLDYFGDFRVLYDYFFPDILPGTATNIPPALMRHWTPKFEGMALSALAQSPANAGYLMSTSGAAYVPTEPVTVGQTTSGVLWYNVYAMENAKDVLGGNPFDNTHRLYSGSADDSALNAGVRRYKASPKALANLDAYQTTGQLTRPLVTLHTALDPIVPAAHEAWYAQKAALAGSSSRFTPIVIPDRYGHCNFTSDEVLQAFGLLLQQPVN